MKEGLFCMGDGQGKSFCGSDTSAESISIEEARRAFHGSVTVSFKGPKVKLNLCRRSREANQVRSEA